MPVEIFVVKPNSMTTRTAPNMCDEGSKPFPDTFIQVIQSHPYLFNSIGARSVVNDSHKRKQAYDQANCGLRFLSLASHYSSLQYSIQETILGTSTHLFHKKKMEQKSINAKSEMDTRSHPLNFSEEQIAR